MALLNYSVLFITLLLLAYLLYRVFQNSSTAGSFAIIASPESELNSMKSSLPITIQNANLVIALHNKQKWNATMNQCLIKASYNSACTGSFMDEDALKYVISRGCRYLDLEIFYIKSIPYVGVSSDNSILEPETRNTITLDSAFTTIVTNAFNSKSAPNIQDPLFINLRIKSNNPDVFQAVAQSIDARLTMKLNTSKINTKKTFLNDIKGKINISIDIVCQPYWKKDSECKPGKSRCYDLTRKVTLETGSENIEIIKWGDLLDEYPINIFIQNNGMDVNTQSTYLIEPDNSIQNNPPTISPIILKYGGQVIPHCFYSNDEGLQAYETLFNDRNAGIIPISSTLQYFNKMV